MTTHYHPGASWVIVDKSNGMAVFETFDIETVNRLDTNRFEAVPIGEYLGKFNASIKEEL